MKTQIKTTLPAIAALAGLISLAGRMGNGAKTAATDSAKTDSAKKDTAAKGGALSLLNKVNKGSSKDTSLLGSKAKLAQQNPLYAVLQPAVGQGQNGQPQLRPGPVVGYSDQKDTAKVNAYLRSTDVKATIPRNMKFLWGVKPIEKTKIFEQNKSFEMIRSNRTPADSSFI